MTTTTATNFAYKSGDSVTNITIPLPNTYPLTKGQQSLVDFAIAHGWTLDITAISNTYGYRLDEQKDEDYRRTFLKQHPFKFVRPSTDGGTWQVTLDYASREYSNYGRRGFNKTLKGAKLTLTAADGTRTLFDAELSGYSTRTGNKDNDEVMLQPTSTASYNHTNWVWDAALVDDGFSLRERVEVLLTDPDAVVAKAAVLMAESKARKEAWRAEKEAERVARGRPLPAGWDGLQAAAKAVSQANGISDTDALLVALKAALAAVEASS